MERDEPTRERTSCFPPEIWIFFSVQLPKGLRLLFPEKTEKFWLYAPFLWVFCALRCLPSEIRAVLRVQAIVQCGGGVRPFKTVPLLFVDEIRGICVGNKLQF